MSKKQVLSLVQVITIMGSPKSEDLLVLDTRNIANKNKVNIINLIVTLGNEQFSNFVKSCLKSPIKSLFDPIRKDKLPIFSDETTKRTSND